MSNKRANSNHLIHTFFTDKGEWKSKQDVTRYAYIKFCNESWKYKYKELKVYLNQEDLEEFLKHRIQEYVYMGGLGNYEHPFNELFYYATETGYRKNKYIMRTLKILADRENEQILAKCLPEEKAKSVA
jgi:hypothetical protein